jgi:uncharacterized membrane protein
MDNSSALKVELHETEQRLLNELRTLRRGVRKKGIGTEADENQLTIGQRIADTVAATMGSWRFIIIQSYQRRERMTRGGSRIAKSLNR